MSRLNMLPNSPTNPISLDEFGARIEAQFNYLIKEVNGLKLLLSSLRTLQLIKPKQIVYADTCSYARCDIWDKKPCSCKSEIQSLHWDGNPTEAGIILKVPVSSFREFVYNKGRFWCWRWVFKIVTEKSYLEEAKTRPEIFYDIFTYPVKTDYLTPETTRAAVQRWLRTYCPKLNYKLDLVLTDIDINNMRRI